MADEQKDSETCEDCARRAFLQTAGVIGIAVTAFGLGAIDASALPLAFVEGVQAGGERRYPIPASDAVNVDRGANLIVTRYQNHVYVFSLACPHQSAPVKWMPKDNRYQCTKHDSRYQPDGVHISGRATRNLDRYSIRRDGDQVVVDLHHWVQSDKDPAGWTAAALAV